ncbi:procollagen-proline 4-dioxygenase [Ranunculus cassubicifolius]
MKAKNKFGGGIVVGSNRNSLRKKKLSLPIVLLFCSAFFLAGFYGSMLLSQQDIARIRPRSRLLHVDNHDDDQMETQQHESITSGDTDNDLIASIGAINDI